MRLEQLLRDFFGGGVSPWGSTKPCGGLLGVPIDYPCGAVGIAPRGRNWGDNDGIQRSAAQIRLPNNASAASPRNAPTSLCVVCFRDPIRLGPKNPPLEPIALTKPIPAAADVPFKNLVGRHQNEPRNKGLTAAIRANAATRGGEGAISAAAMHPAQANASPSEATAQRSSLRSDSIPAKKYPGIASA